MIALILSLELIHKYNQLPLEKVVEEFENFSGQMIPKKVVQDFEKKGLNNVDLLTSDYLNHYNLKNINQL